MYLKRNYILHNKEQVRDPVLVCQNCLTRIRLGISVKKVMDEGIYARLENKKYSVLDLMIKCCPKPDLYWRNEYLGNRAWKEAIARHNTIRYIKKEELLRRLMLFQL